MTNTIALLVAGGYAAASVVYIADFIARRQQTRQAGSWLLYLTLVTHTVWLVLLHVRLGHLPIGNRYHATSTVAWGIALAYVVIELRLGRRGFGAFVTPVVFLFQAVAAVFLALTPAPGPMGSLSKTLWFEVHVGTALFSYCAFAIAFAAGLMHILLFHEIRLKRLGFFFMRMPPLEELERINYQSVSLGFLFLTIGILSGVVWGLEGQGTRLLMDSKEVSAISVWLLYAINLHTRWSLGWRGQRTAVFSVANFVLLFAVFCLTSFVLGSHQF